MLFNTSNISIDTIANDCLIKKNISLSIIRLDKIHPVVSGNKLFKLHYFLQQAIDNKLRGLLTFGGAYSNHLVATAFACKTLGLKSIGFVRGEKPAFLSPTLLACIAYGMQLHFISREEYDTKEDALFLANLSDKWQGFLQVPEGGYHPKGAAGAALINNFIKKDTTHICTALGTATTFAGLIAGASPTQQIVGVPVLKGMVDIAQRVPYLTESSHPLPNGLVGQAYQLLDGYHFGGYAKKTPALLQFMNTLFQQHNLPTDFVYTAKMMFAILDTIEKGFFAEGSKIACLHTGGLQGNKSLPAGSLIF